jgi:hypothetical protein
MAVSMLYWYTLSRNVKRLRKKQIFLGKYTKTTDILLSWIKLCPSSLYFYLSHKFMGVIQNIFYEPAAMQS